MNQVAVPRRKWIAVGALLAMLAAGIVSISTWAAAPAQAAIAGLNPIFTAADQQLDENSERCDGDYCVTYNLNLPDGVVVQAQLDNPTSRAELTLWDDLDNKVESIRVSQGDSGWLNAAVDSDGESTLHLDAITHPGKHSLTVSSRDKIHFTWSAFTIPDNLKMVGINSSLKGKFSDDTTRQISGKYTNYWDGVVFNGKKGQSFSAIFTKTGDPDATITLYDEFHNKLISHRSSDEASIDKYSLPYTGLYELTIQAKSQGNYTLRLDNPTPCTPFPDVNRSNTHCYNISWLKDRTITIPEDGFYHPSSAVTRGQMALFIYRLVNNNKPAPKCSVKPFEDVKTSNVFCGAIEWAAQKHVTAGIKGTHKFNPNGKVTRGQMSAFLKRIGDTHRTPQCDPHLFADVTSSNTFCGTIKWMADNKITSGVGDGSRYAPNSVVNRDQMASFLHRIYDYRKDNPAIAPKY